MRCSLAGGLLLVLLGCGRDDRAEASRTAESEVASPPAIARPSAAPTASVPEGATPMVAPGASVAATAITVPSTSGASGAGGPPEPVQPGAGAAPDPGVQVIQAKTEDGKTAAIELEAPRGWEIVRPPTSPDPHGGKFTLKEALAGLGGAGSLVARIQTSLGSLYCDLFDGKVPNTVANFVGLARGKRKFWDENAQAWVARPFYPGTTFHRVVPGAYIHGGDPTGTGRGRIGYMIPNEFHPSLSQDRGGRLCMAQRAANTNGAQFFVTESAVRDYEGRFSIFGQCQPLALVARIAHAPQSGPPAFRPVQPVVIEVVEVKRVAGGAAAWMPASAARAAEKAMPPGVVPEGRAVQVDDDEDDDVR